MRTRQLTAMQAAKRLGAQLVQSPCTSQSCSEQVQEVDFVLFLRLMSLSIAPGRSQSQRAAAKAASGTKTLANKKGRLDAVEAAPHAH